MNREQQALWIRVEEALDARRDPLQEPSLQRALGKDAHMLAAVQRLVARLELLPEPATSEPSRSMPLVASALAVAAVLTGLLAFWIAARPKSRALPVDTVTVTVEHILPTAPRGRQVTLEPRPVLGWTLQGDRP